MLHLSATERYIFYVVWFSAIPSTPLPSPLHLPLTIFRFMNLKSICSDVSSFKTCQHLSTFNKYHIQLDSLYRWCSHHWIALGKTVRDLLELWTNIYQIFNIGGFSRLVINLKGLGSAVNSTGFSFCFLYKFCLWKMFY